MAADDDCARRLAALARLSTVNRRAPALRMSDLVCSLHRFLCHTYQTILAPSSRLLAFATTTARPHPPVPRQRTYPCHKATEFKPASYTISTCAESRMSCGEAADSSGMKNHNLTSWALQHAITPNVPAGQPATDYYPRKAVSLVTTDECLSTAP